MVNVNEYQKLLDFKNQKTNIHSFGNLINIDNWNPCDVALYVGNPNGGYSSVAPGVNHFMMIIDDNTDCGGLGNGDGGNGNGGNNNSNPTYNETYTEIAQISQTMESCTGYEPFLSNLFGEVKVCKDYYNSDNRRVKVKYWQVDLGLFYSVGVKVKNQKKGWTGIWRKIDTDKVALGINSVTWKFNLPTTVNTSNLFNYQPARIYFDGKMYETLSDYSNATFGGNLPMPNLPFSPDLDALVEFARVLPYGAGSSFDSEEEIRNYFYSNLFNTVKNLFQTQQNKELNYYQLQAGRFDYA